MEARKIVLHLHVDACGYARPSMPPRAIGSASSGVASLSLNSTSQPQLSM